MLAGILGHFGAVFLGIVRLVALAMATAIDNHNAPAGVYDCGNLVASIAAVAEATMQHNHAAAGPKCRVPDARGLMVHVALIIRGREGFGAVLFEIREVVVA